MTDQPEHAPTSLLTLGSAVELGHALVQHIAEQSGTRVLFIKGPVADARGVRAPRVSADVDVLVAATDLAALVDKLGHRGWIRRPESFAHAAFVQHSITLLHPGWPCDIDLHVSYPGFLADPSIVFGALWSRREPLSLAGRKVDAPDFVGSALIAALHSLRAPYLDRNRCEFDDALAAVRSQIDRDEVIEQIASLAEATGSRHTAKPFLVALGQTVLGPAPRTPEYFAWRRGARQLNRSAQWLRAILDAPAKDVPDLIRRAILPSRRDLLTDHPGTVDTAAGLIVARLIRLADGARAMPAAMSTLWEERSMPRRWPETTERTAEFEARLPSPVAEKRTIPRDNDRHPTPPLVCRSRHIGEVVQGDTIVLLDLAGRQSSPLVIAGSAQRIWLALDVPRSRDAVVTKIADAYEVDPTSVAEGVSTFLDRLVELGVARLDSVRPAPSEVSKT